MISIRQQHIFAYLLILGLILLVHFPQTSSDFTFDDRRFVETNQSLRSLPGTLRALLQPFPPEKPELGLYRPLTNASYALDYAIWQDRAFGFHLSNIILYALLVLFIYRLGCLYSPDRGFALVLALLFAIHPIHTEAVDAIAGRSELLSLLFCVLSLIIFLPAARRAASGARNAAVLLSALLYLVACLCKETGVMLLGVLLVHRLVWLPNAGCVQATLRRLKILLPHAVVVVLYLLLRFTVLGRFGPEVTTLEGRGWITRLDLIGNVFLTQISKISWPSNLQIDFYYYQSIELHDEISVSGLLGLGFLACVCAFFTWLLLRHLQAATDTRIDRTRAIVLSGGAMFLCMSFPTMHILNIGAIFAERFTFAPSLGFSIILAALLKPVSRFVPSSLRTVSLTVFMAVLVLVGGIVSANRAREWRQPLLLWQSAARMMPDNPRVHLNLGGVLMRQDELILASQSLQRALELEPQFLAALGNLGVLSMKMGDLDQAEKQFRKILEIDTGDFLAWSNLGLLAYARGQHEEAIGFFQKALAINPNYSDAHRFLAEAERDLKNLQGNDN